MRPAQAAKLLDLENKYPDLVERLGCEPDTVLGRAYGLSRERIGQLRQQKGIAPFAPCLPPDLEGTHPGLAARLGREPDADLGRAYGLSRERIRQLRRRRGIAPFCSTIPPEIKALLGVITDKEIHRRYPKISVFRLRQFRAELNIPSPALAARQKVESVRDRLGVEPDGKIARELGVAIRTVLNYRNEHNIRPFGCSSTTGDRNGGK